MRLLVWAFSLQATEEIAFGTLRSNETYYSAPEGLKKVLYSPRIVKVKILVRGKKHLLVRQLGEKLLVNYDFAFEPAVRNLLLSFENCLVAGDLAENVPMYTDDWERSNYGLTAIGKREALCCGMLPFEGDYRKQAEEAVDITRKWLGCWQFIWDVNWHCLSPNNIKDVVVVMTKLHLLCPESLCHAMPWEMLQSIFYWL